MKNKIIILIVSFFLISCFRSNEKKSEYLINSNYCIDTFESNEKEKNSTIQWTPILCDYNNKTDSFGRKQGWWIIKNGPLYEQIYYKDGLRQGFYKEYLAAFGTISCLGEYKNDKETGTWYIFNSQGLLIGINKDIKINKNVIIKDDAGKWVKFTYITYAINYYPSGIIRSEGMMVYEDIVDFWEYGLWKYYNEKGELIKTENKSIYKIE